MVKRILSLILAMCMLLDVMTLNVIAASDGDNVLSLPTGMPEELLKSDKAGGVFIVGTLNATVEEKGRIEVKIHRTGKSDEKASINLSTVDIGALYGKDYRIDDDRYDIDEHPADKTLYEQSVTPERRQKLDEYRKSVENTMNYLSGNIKDNNTEKNNSGDNEANEDNSGGNTEANEDSGNAEANEDSGNAEANEDNGNAEANEDSGNAETNEDSGNAEANEDNGNAEVNEENGDNAENTADSSYNEIKAADSVETAAKMVLNIFDSETVSEENSSNENQEDVNSDEFEQSENEETSGEENAAPPSLASLKAAQTGLPTREAESADSDYDKMVEDLIGEVSKEGIASFVDTSSETILTFEPGETEKTVIFEIMEDDESEGDEIFSIELSHPSENSELGQPARCVISIKDDEPKVHPKLSFTKESFQASGDGTATIRVKRDGAPYALCTATVETAEGSLSGLIFEPFEMEKTVNITATKGSEAIKVKLGNLAGADAGELLEATVNPPKDKSLLASAASDKDGEVSLAAASGNTERSIDIKGADGSTKSYTLKYNLNEPMGTMYDENGYAVGDFYFPNDVENGGIWKFHVSDSPSATAHEAKYYPGTSDQDAYAHLKFYTPVNWEIGGASMSSNEIPFKKYSGFSIDWRQDSHTACKGGEIEFDLWNERHRGAAFHSLGKKTFKRCMSEVFPVLLDNNVMPGLNGSLYINFSDDDSTPIVSPLINCDGYVYGVAAFYRRYALNLLQPDRVSFRTAEGRYTYHTPAQASLQIGHEERWQGQTATIMSLPASQEEGVYCYLDHYKITTGESREKEVTFEYYPEEHPDENGNIHYDSLPFNEQWFIDLIDKNTKEVTTDHLGYHTKLTIKPIYEQKEAVVRVFDGVYEGNSKVDSTPGGFTLDDLKPGVHVLKQGDEVDLRATPSSDNFFLKGTEVWIYDSYYNYSDTPEDCKGIGQPKYHATLWSDSRIMTYTLKDSYMEIKPIFSDSVNYIAVRGVNEDDIIAEELSKEEVKAKYKAISGKEAPDWLLKERIVALNPPVGELFNINIIQKKYTKIDYRGKDYSYDYAMLQGKDSPDISSNNTINTNSNRRFYSFGSSFDVEVKPSAEENTVWAATLYRYQQSGSWAVMDRMETVKIKGRVTTSGVTLLSSANYNNRNKKIGTPVAGAVVSAGGYQSKIYNMKKWREEDIIYRYTATTDKDGYFEIAGRFGCNYANNISLRVDAGGMSTKYDLTPSYKKSEKITYTKTTLNGRDITTKTITEDGYNYSYDKYGEEKIYDIEMPVASLTTPEPSHIWYEFTKPSSYQQGADTRNTSIPILDDEVVFTMYADRKGKELKRAEFILNHEKGEPDVFEVAPDKNAPNVFIWRLNMTEAKENEQLMNNDFLTVRLVDAEDETYTTSVWDPITGETSTSTQTREQVYLPVHTGLSFSDVSEKPFVQTWEFESDDVLRSVPVFDNLIPNATSGKLNIKKKDIAAGLENNPYVIQVGFDVSYGNKAAKSPEDILKMANNYCKNSTATGLTRQVVNAHNSNDTEKWDDQLKDLKRNVEDTFTDMSKGFSDFAKDVNEGKYDGYTQKELDEIADKIQHDAEKKAKETISNRAKESAKKSIAEMNKAGIKYKTGFNFVLADVYVWDDKNKEYVSVGCQYSVGACASVMGTHYWLCGGKVPLYIMLSGDFTLSVSGYDHHEGLDRITANDFYGAENLNNLYNGDIRLETSVSVQMTVGVGICNVLGARGYVSLKPIYSFYKDQKSEVSDKPVFYHGLQAKISGGFSIDLVLFSIDYAPEYMSASVGNLASAPKASLQSLDNGTTTVRSADIGGKISSFNSDVSLQSSYDTVKIDTLLENAPEHARPKIIRLDDGRQFLVFVANTGAETGSEYNGLTLMYSICSNNGTWSNPQPVDGNKTLDSFPMLYTDGKNVVVTWSDANRSFEKDENKKDMLSSLDISYRIYDSVNNSWSDKDTLSEISENLNFMDANPQVSYDETAKRLIVYYHKWDYGKATGETDLVDPELCYNTMAYRVRNTETKEWIKDDAGSSEFYLSLRHPTIDDPMVLDFSQQTKLIDGHYMTFAVYTVDEDKNLQTGDDRDVYLFTYDVTEQKEYFPINLSNDHKSDTSPKINDLNGKLTVTWISDNTTLQVLNLENIIQQTKDNGEAWRFANYKDSDRDPNWLSSSLADWTYKAPSENGSVDKNSVYKMLKEGSFPIQSVNFSMPDTEDYVPLGYYQVVGVNTNDSYKTYVLWTAPGSVDANDHSQELYGAVYTSEEGWGETVKLTETGKAIDNFSVSIAPDLSMTLAANCYEQSENSDGTLKLGQNSLVCAYLKPVSSIKPESISVDKQYPRAGETCEVSVNVKNNGLNAANGYNVSLYKSDSKNETLIGTVSNDDTIPSGDSSVAVFEWQVPEDFNSGIILTAKCSESGMEGEDTANCYVPHNSFLEAKGLRVEETPEGLFFNVSVSNEGNTPNSETVLDLNKYGKSDKIFANIQVPEIQPGEKAELRTPMNIAAEDLGSLDTAIFTLNAPEDVNFSVTGKAVYRATQPFEITVNDGIKNLTMKAGEVQNLSVSLKPDTLSDTGMAYSSSNENVAKVDSFGNISALSEGKTDITVTHKTSGVSSVIKVTVSGKLSDNTESDNKRGGGSPKRRESSSEETTDTQPEKSDENTTQTQNNSSDANSPFTDIKGHWAEDDINYAAESGLFKGTSETTFSPNGSLTRGMLAAVLYRYAGSPQISGEQKFTDVSENAYYSDAVIWAESNGIVFGRGNGKFDPDSFITRQDFTAMLYRATGSPKTSGELSDFKDIQSISDYAKEAMLWAVQNSILYGTPESMLKPIDNVTRGETAAMINRFAQYEDGNK